MAIDMDRGNFNEYTNHFALLLHQIRLENGRDELHWQNVEPSGIWDNNNSHE